MDNFDAFWAVYPRREGKKDAMKAWAQMSEEQQFAARESLPIHVKYWDLAGRTKQFIPMAATWLRGERWSDELSMPTLQEEWFRSTAGIQRKAKELGVEPKAGEDWMSLKARIMAKAAA